MAGDRAPVVTRVDVAAVLHKYPSLSAYGMGHGGRAVDKHEFDRARSYLLDAVDEVQCAVDWLRRHPEAAGSSYCLKHLAERECGCGYVSNGALIVALILLNRRMKGGRDCVNPVVVKRRTALGARPSAVTATRPTPVGTSR